MNIIAQKGRHADVLLGAFLTFRNIQHELDTRTDRIDKIREKKVVNPFILGLFRIRPYSENEKVKRVNQNRKIVGIRMCFRFSINFIPLSEKLKVHLDFFITLN